VVLEWLPGPCLLHDPEIVFDDRAAPIEVDAEERALVRPVADPDDV
jgi:hypothetical protein